MENKHNLTFQQGKEPQSSDILFCEGDLRVQHALEIKKELIANISNSTALRVVVRKDTPFDISFLQLLLAVKAKMDSQESAFELDFEMNKEAEALMAASGFNGLLFPKK